MTELVSGGAPPPTAVEQMRVRSNLASFRTLFWGYVGASVVVSTAAFVLAAGSTTWLGIQTLAILAAGAIYLRYTHETIRLREAAEDQILIAQEHADVAVRPLVVAVVPAESGKLALKNIGNGPAVNIRVFTTVTGEDAGLTFSYRFPLGLGALGSGEVDSIAVQQWIDEHHSPKSIVDLRPQQIVGAFELRIEYSSAHQHMYLSRMLVASSGYELAQISELPGQFH